MHVLGGVEPRIGGAVAGAGCRALQETPALIPGASVVVPDRIFFVVLRGENEVAALGEMAPEGHRVFGVLVVAAARLPNLAGALEPIELRVENEVDYACDRVATVRGARTASDRVDALDDRLRKQVDVGAPVQGGIHHPSAVQQCERALGAHAAQVE